jgi:chorismate mutase-like protein
MTASRLATLCLLLAPALLFAQSPATAPVRPAPPPPAELVRARERIDAIDRQLLDLLSERARIVVQVGEIKRARHLPVHNPAREKQVVAALTAGKPGPLPPPSIERIWQQIFAEMRLLESTPAPATH